MGDQCRRVELRQLGKKKKIQRVFASTAQLIVSSINTPGSSSTARRGGSVRVSVNACCWLEHDCKGCKGRDELMGCVVCSAFAVAAL